MKIVVMKFGGTSVSTASKRRDVISRIREGLAGGCRVITVVSAMGRGGEPYATDTLFDLLPRGDSIPKREIDAICATGEEISAALLATELNDSEIPAISLRGWQAGIVTDEVFGDASIREIRPARLLEELGQAKVVVVTGYQGVTTSGEITTLGRGGSDTSAIALGAALRAERVEIFTDVKGVLTADPKIVPDAGLVAEVTYTEAADLALHGAAVLHPRAAEIAGLARLDVYIRSSFSPLPGTRIVSDTDFSESEPRAIAPRTVAVTSNTAITRFSARAALSDSPGLLAAVFGAIAGEGISLDMISISTESFAFTVKDQDAPRVNAMLKRFGLESKKNECIAKVTLVGGRIHGIPGIMHRIVRALAGRGISIYQSVDSNMIISVLVAEEKENEAVRALHEEFFRAIDCD